MPTTQDAALTPLAIYADNRNLVSDFSGGVLRRTDYPRPNACSDPDQQPLGTWMWEDEVAGEPAPQVDFEPTETGGVIITPQFNSDFAGMTLTYRGFGETIAVTGYPGSLSALTPFAYTFDIEAINRWPSQTVFRYNWPGFVEPPSPGVERMEITGIRIMGGMTFDRPGSYAGSFVSPLGIDGGRQAVIFTTETGDPAGCEMNIPWHYHVSMNFGVRFQSGVVAAHIENVSVNRIGRWPSSSYRLAPLG